MKATEKAGKQSSEAPRPPDPDLYAGLPDRVRAEAEEYMKKSAIARMEKERKEREEEELWEKCRHLTRYYFWGVLIWGFIWGVIFADGIRWLLFRLFYWAK